MVIFRDDTIRHKSERLRDEAEKLIQSRENKTVQTQHSSNLKLNNRLHDVVLFRAELEVHELIWHICIDKLFCEMETYIVILIFASFFT